jgi:hypothetical protein
MNAQERAKAWAIEARNSCMNDLADALDRFAERERAAILECLKNNPAQAVNQGAER